MHLAGPILGIAACHFLTRLAIPYDINAICLQHRCWPSMQLDGKLTVTLPSFGTPEEAQDGITDEMMASFVEIMKSYGDGEVEFEVPLSGVSRFQHGLDELLRRKNQQRVKVNRYVPEHNSLVYTAATVPAYVTAVNRVNAVITYRDENGEVYVLLAVRNGKWRAFSSEVDSGDFQLDAVLSQLYFDIGVDIADTEQFPSPVKLIGHTVEQRKRPALVNTVDTFAIESATKFDVTLNGQLADIEAAEWFKLSDISADSLTAAPIFSADGQMTGVYYFDRKLVHSLANYADGKYLVVVSSQAGNVKTMQCKN